MFAVTRTLWTEGFSEEEMAKWYEGKDPDDPMESFAICLLICPIAIDVIFLPITITHDLFYVD
jgi:hypothetical protein